MNWIDVKDSLPNRDEVVVVRNVWNDKESKVIYQGAVSSLYPEKGRYEGFGCYGEGCITHWAKSIRDLKGKV